MKKVVSAIYIVVLTLLFIEIMSLVNVDMFGDIVKQHHKRLGKNGILDEIYLYPNVSDDTEDQIMKKGQFAHYPHARATIIICHGFSCDHQDVSVLRHIFDEGPYNVLSFDFRAHGDLLGSDDVTQYCTFGKDEVHDLSAALNFITHYPLQEVSSKPIFIYGFSMGAVVAIEAVAKYKNEIKGMILDCPFESSEQVVKRGVEDIFFEIFGYKIACPGTSILKEYAFHPYVQGVVKRVLKTVANLDTKDIITDLRPVYPIESIKSISIPSLFIHCRNDKKIPLDAVMSLYNHAPGYKRLWVTKGRGHFGSFFYRPETYKKVVQAFLDKVITLGDMIASSKQDTIVFDDAEEMNNKQVIKELNF